MSNSFYNQSSTPVYRSQGSSALIRAEFGSIVSGFNKMPTLSVGTANRMVTVDPTGAFLTALDLFTGNGSKVVQINAGATAFTTADVATLLIVQPWVSGTTYAIGNVVYSPINFTDYRRITAGAGATDPSLDTTNWASRYLATQVWLTKTTNWTAAAGQAIMADTTLAAFTVNLPVTPVANDKVRICDYAGTFHLFALTVGRNGSNIMGSATDMTVNTRYASIELTYIDSTQGWKLT